VCGPLLFLNFLDYVSITFLTHVYQTLKWYQNEVISFREMPLLLRFSSFNEEQRYLGSMINVNIMVAAEVFTSTCEPDKNRRLRKARENPNELANNPRSLVGSRR
jgi:hypothetical protein